MDVILLIEMICKRFRDFLYNFMPKEYKCKQLHYEKLLKIDFL